MKATADQNRLEYYFVAFIDILGFSQMVEEDCSGPAEAMMHLPKLIKLYESIMDNGVNDKSLSIIQFSDSIVLSQKYSPGIFEAFAKKVIKFQHSLLINGVLCRGGISYGKHYERSNFLFSEALIKAYRIESGEANYPRIVIDSDLVDLLYPNGSLPRSLIIKEADGAMFLDYLSAGELDQNFQAIQSLTVCWEEKQVKVREKLRWLREYFSFNQPSRSDLLVNRFEKI